MKKTMSLLLSVTMTFLILAGLIVPSFAASSALPKQIVNTKTNETYTFQYDKGNRTIRINTTIKKTPSEEKYGYENLTEELVPMLGISDNIQYQNLSLVSEDPIIVFALWQPVREGQYDTVLISGKGTTEEYWYVRDDNGIIIGCCPEDPDYGDVLDCQYFFFDEGQLNGAVVYYINRYDQNLLSGNGSMWFYYGSGGALKRYERQESSGPGANGITTVTTDSKKRT